MILKRFPALVAIHHDVNQWSLIRPHDPPPWSCKMFEGFYQNRRGFQNRWHKSADNCKPKNSSCNVLSEIANLSFYSNQCRCKYPTSNIQRNMQSCSQKFLGIPDGPLDFWAYGRQRRNSLASSRVLSWHPSQLDITLPTTLALPKLGISNSLNVHACNN